MNYVEPIRDVEKVKQLADYLKSKNERDHLLFCFGIYTGLRISDILAVKKKMVKGTTLVLVEQKTKKTKRVPIVPKLKRLINKYITDLDEDEYLFHGRSRNKPMSRVRAYQILKEAADLFDIKSMGTHTLRKTFGYHFYQEHRNVAMLQSIFNHSQESITLIYIGVNQDEIEDAMKGLPY